MAQLSDFALENELREIVAQVIEADPGKITLSADFVEDLGMDSMMALEIMASIEKKYKIRVSEEKLAKLRNLREAIILTKEYL
jgi:acyl carrier protein